MRALLLTLALLTGCIRCPVGAQRCDKDVASVCLSNGTWFRVEDCGAVTPGRWTCEMGDAGAACLPMRQ